MKKLILFIISSLPLLLTSEKAIAQNQDEGAKIDKLRDGVYYELQYKIYEYKPCSCCGYNSLSFPKKGKFENEVRRYYRIKNGEETEVWYKTVEIKWTGECVN